MRFPRAVLVVLSLSILVPMASAHHPCEAWCAGGLSHAEGSGHCAGDAQRSYLIFGAESHDESTDALVGAGHLCEEKEDGLYERTGVFVYSDQDGQPVRVFVGIDERPEECGVVLGVLYVSHASPNSPFCELA